MSDDFDRLDKLTDKLVASPALLKAWRASSAIGSSYAWHILNHSWQLPPEVPREYIPHNPRLTLWDNAAGWSDHNPYTLIVFRGLKGPVRCRHAVWHIKQVGELKKQFVDFFENGGQVQFFEPNITFTDAEVSFDELRLHLRAIAAHRIPAISLQAPSDHSVTTDVGSVGFEYFSQNQPPAGIKFQWSDHTPSEWRPLISKIEQLREFLFGCFKTPL